MYTFLAFCFLRILSDFTCSAPLGVYISYIYVFPSRTWVMQILDSTPAYIGYLTLLCLLGGWMFVFLEAGQVNLTHVFEPAPCGNIFVNETGVVDPPAKHPLFLSLSLSLSLPPTLLNMQDNELETMKADADLLQELCVFSLVPTCPFTISFPTSHTSILQLLSSNRFTSHFPKTKISCRQ
jgi:hypothetical protein